MAILVTKSLYVQRPSFSEDGGINGWQEQQAWGFATPEDRTAIMLIARPIAKQCGGRIVLVITTTDNKDSADETVWDIKYDHKVLVSRVVTSATVTAQKDAWARALPLLQGTPGMKALADAIAAAIA